MRHEPAQPSAAGRDGVHERTARRHEPLEPGYDGVSGERSTRQREVGGGAAIEAAKLEHTLRPERFRLASRVAHERLEPAPGLVPVTDESV